MTRVLVDVRRANGSLPDGPSAGSLRWRPHARLSGDGWVRPPAGFIVPLDADGTASVEVLPGFWWVSEMVSAGLADRLLLVPDTAEADYSALVEVDPGTLEPAPEPLAGWTAVLAEVGEYRTQAAGSAASAVQSAGYADAAELGAVDAATAAALARDTAVQAAADARLTIDHDPAVGWVYTRGGA